MDLFYQHFDSSETLLPPGFRFHPTDEELITYYLLKKVLDHNFTGRAIAQVDLNKCEPWQLPEKAKMGEREWYFYSLRDRKYPSLLRTNRATEAGYWKATGKDREIYSSKTCYLVGMKKTLVFYKGRAPKGEKTNWVVHEFRLDGKLSYHYLSNSSKDEWVISRVFHKNGAGSTTKKLYPEISSSSSASNPHPLDSISYASGAVSVTDRNSSCSYDEHVPCFSTSSASTSSFNHNFPLFQDNNSHYQGYNVGMVDSVSSFSPSSSSSSSSFFPCLRSLQEKLHHPFFLPPPPMHDGAADQTGSSGHYLSAAGNWAVPETQKPGPTELDCIWSF